MRHSFAFIILAFFALFFFVGVVDAETLIGHCDCDKGCEEYSYKDQTEYNNAINYCKSDKCSKTPKTFLAGKCPQATTPAATSKSKTPSVVSLENPLEGGVTKPTEIIGRIIKVALSIMGGLVLLMVVWGGFQWLTAAGSPEKVKSGMQTILWAVLGAAITLSSYVILNTILSYLQK
jgi:hypothetical protein